MILPDFQSYRFSLRLSAKWFHAWASPHCLLTACPLWEVILSRNLHPRVLDHPSGGHARTAAPSLLGRLLLPLCGITPARRLREDVRFEEIRFAVVGKNLREAPHADTGRQFACRPAVPSSRPGRARQALEAVSSLKF